MNNYSKTLKQQRKYILFTQQESNDIRYWQGKTEVLSLLAGKNIWNLSFDTLSEAQEQVSNWLPRIMYIYECVKYTDNDGSSYFNWKKVVQ